MAWGKSTRSFALSEGFTLIELLVVIAIIALLAAVVLASLSQARSKSKYSANLAEMSQIRVAIEEYASDHNGNYPPDVDRGLPPGAEAYMSDGKWPTPPYPGSFYDWDNWPAATLSDAPYADVVQVSTRFCDINGTQCLFPSDSWAAGFGVDSSLYLCMEGPCRAHNSEPYTYPAHCANCK
jgi:prepilin-type N-terminal cleavage/methylation domain-containing protein